MPQQTEDSTPEFDVSNAEIEASTRRPSRRAARVRFSCLRCQRRKIRCDGALPSCTNCSRARVPCLDGDHLRGRDLPRAYISSLEDRVMWLESTLKSHCPDVDLSNGPRRGENSMPPAISNQSSAGQIQQSVGSVASLSSEQQNSNERSTKSEATLGLDSEGLVHEIGLVSLQDGTDPKYIGPSSGFFFAKRMLASLDQSSRMRRPENSSGGASRLNYADFFQSDQAKIPSSSERILQITRSYFELVHDQYPFLHRPSFSVMVDRVISDEIVDHTADFQVNMVLCISLMLSNQGRLSSLSEGYFANAMSCLSHITTESSIEGLQCLLLLQIYAMHHPTTHLNAWYLNYQCIASVVDLGLQRDVRSGGRISELDVQIRTRVFWTVYSIDRSLATMMGRPIGLRDEACDLRLPLDIDETEFEHSDRQQTQKDGPGHMSMAIHLFRLYELNSEMKYVLHSVSRAPIAHATPNIPDIDAWQESALKRLNAWYKEIPRWGTLTRRNIICQIRYHSMVQFLLRPSPAIPAPQPGRLLACYESAVSCVRLLHALYRDDIIVYQSAVIHQLILSTVTMFHCIWNFPAIFKELKVDVFTADVGAAVTVLAAAGGHWHGAKRSSLFLDDLSRSIVRRLIDAKDVTHADTSNADMHKTKSAFPSNAVTPAETNMSYGWDGKVSSALDPSMETSRLAEVDSYPSSSESQPIPFEIGAMGDSSLMDFTGLISNDFPSLFEGQDGPTGNFDTMMQGMFDDWFPKTIEMQVPLEADTNQE